MTLNTGNLRGDFANALQTGFRQKLGLSGTESRDRMEKIYDSVLTNGELDVNKLPEQTQKDLAKLQKASEGFESFFVKKLLSQMRQTSFGGTKDQGPMMDFAKEQMDQAVADEAAKGNGSIGIAHDVFLSQAVTLVQQVASQAANPSK